MALWTNPWLRGLMTFLILRIAVSPFLGSTRCRDGWASASIGRQGACSWHGGVGTREGQWMIFLAFVVSVAVGIHAAFRKEAAEKAATVALPRMPPSAVTRVPAPPVQKEEKKAAPPPNENELKEATRRGEAATRAQLELYFGPGGKPPPPNPRKSQTRRRRRY
jgi:hypothetical protein